MQGPPALSPASTLCFTYGVAPLCQVTKQEAFLSLISNAIALLGCTFQLFHCVVLRLTHQQSYWPPHKLKPKRKFQPLPCRPLQLHQLKKNWIKSSNFESSTRFPTEHLCRKTSLPARSKAQAALMDLASRAQLPSLLLSPCNNSSPSCGGSGHGSGDSSGSPSAFPAFEAALLAMIRVSLPASLPRTTSWSVPPPQQQLQYHSAHRLEWLQSVLPRPQC